MGNRLILGTRRYSSWSLRGWLAVHLAGLAVEETTIPLAGGHTPAIREVTDGGTVPYLEHDGCRMWDSLAIAEYCAELKPDLWPLDREGRALARSLAGEMHAGFPDLRRDMPMSLFRSAVGAGRSPGALSDIARVQHLWRHARALTAGTFLFGDSMGIADAMYAPVVARFLTYRPDLTPDSLAYCEAVRAHPLIERWYAEAAQEPPQWFIPAMETPLPAGG